MRKPLRRTTICPVCHKKAKRGGLIITAGTRTLHVMNKVALMAGYTAHVCPEHVKQLHIITTK